MKRYVVLLAAVGPVGSAFVATATASAQTAIAHGEPTPPRKPAVAATPGSSTVATVHLPVAAPAANAENVSVYGQGSTRQLQSISMRTIRDAAPGTSALKILGQLPGVNFQSADPFGAYEWSESLYVRSFSQDQLGFTLDDIPLGDGDYRNYNGLSVTRAIISENIQRVDLSQGAAALDVASSSDLGGALQFSSIDPANKFGGAVQQTFGSDNTYRTYARVDSGVLNTTGTKFYASFARSDLDKWKGTGGNHYDQVNAKLVQPIGDNSSFKAFFDWTQRQEVDYQDLSLNYIKTLGSRVDNSYPDYATAYRAAQGIFTHGETRTNDPLDVSYYEGSGLRQDFLGGGTFDIALSDSVRWKTTLYGHNDDATGTWTDPYLASPNGAAVSQEGGNITLQRFGALSAVTWDSGNNSLNTGVWYENDHYTTNIFYDSDPILGQGVPESPTTAPDISKAFATQWAYAFNTNTFQYHLQDVYHLGPVTLHAGFKSLLVVAHDTITANDEALTGYSSLPSGGLTASDAFLPQFSANWHINNHNELFADIGNTMRSFPQNGLNHFTPFSTGDAAAFAQEQRNLKPEEAWIYEAGYRFQFPYIAGLLTGYHVNFSNRLQTVTSGNIINQVTLVQNVGGVTTNGVEASATLRPFAHVAWYNSISFNHSTFDSNFVDAAGVVPVRGKSIPNYPNLMYKTTLSYNSGNFDAHIDGNYMSHRYLSYLNDVSVPPHFVANLGVRYRFGNYGLLKNVAAEFNVYNLLNTVYIGTMGEEGNPLSGDYQSVMIGAPRQFFGTVSTNF